MISPSHVSRYTFLSEGSRSGVARLSYIYASGIFIPLYKIPRGGIDARMKYLKDSSMFTSAPARRPWDFRAAESIRSGHDLRSRFLNEETETEEDLRSVE